MQQDPLTEQQVPPAPPPLTPEQAAINLLLSRIEKLEKLTQEQQETINDQQDQLQRRRKEKGEIVRPKRPDDFDGQPSGMIKFFAELDTYFSYFPVTLEDDEDKVLFASGCLTGAAAEWFRPILKDFNDTKEEPDKMKDYTSEIFTKFSNFKDQIEKSFGTMNEEREAERELRFLKQKEHSPDTPLLSFDSSPKSTGLSQPKRKSSTIA